MLQKPFSIFFFKLHSLKLSILQINFLFLFPHFTVYSFNWKSLSHYKTLSWNYAKQHNQNSNPHPGGFRPAPDGAVVITELVFPDHRPRVLVSLVRHHVQLGRPQLELPLPVDHGGQGHRDQEGTFRVSLKKMWDNSE